MRNASSVAVRSDALAAVVGLVTDDDVAIRRSFDLVHQLL